MIVTRRSFVGLCTAAPVVVASCVAAPVAATPFRVAEARYRAAIERFNGLPVNLELDDPEQHRREERAMNAAIDAVDQTPVRDWRELADAFEIAFDGGHSLPREDLAFKLLADVRRLAGRAAA